MSRSRRKALVHRFKSPDLEDPERGGRVVPRKIGNIPRLAVLLGMIENLYWEIYNHCLGDKTVEQLAADMDIEPAFMRIFIDKLYKNGLVTLASPN